MYVGFSCGSLPALDHSLGPCILDDVWGHLPFVSVALHAFFLIQFGSQVGSYLEYSLPPKQLQTKNLLSQYDALFLGYSNSGGSSCGPSRYSRPYVLCSATSAASTTIDFSKGSVDDGIVDSPPS